MGGLFSTENDRRKEEASRAAEQHSWYLIREQQQKEAQNRDILRRQQEADRYARQVQLQQEERRRQQEIKRRTEHARTQYRVRSIEIIPNLPYNQPYELTPLSSTSVEYQQLHRKFKRTGKAYMRVISIQSINNPLQKAAYTLKKNEAIRIYDNMGDDIEKDLYHGTSERNFDSICKTNFDRRRCTHHKFGHGVSFSPLSFYATHYCDKGNREKIMLLCKVITMNYAIGDSYTIVPSSDCDYTQNTEKGDVVVKYDDDSFYPEYVIKFRMDQNQDNLEGRFQGMHIHD